MKTIYFITSNQGKLMEFQKKLKQVDIKVVQKNLGYPEIQAENLEDIARFGVEHIQKQFDQPFILEDAGLFIDALNGFPGVYSAYIFYTIGLQSILKLLQGVDNKKRTAVFRSVIAYREPNKKTLFFKGECTGRIAKQNMGSHGFGYDPIFIPDDETKTFAQMKTKEKNCYSHRGNALKKFIYFFKKT